MQFEWDLRQLVLLAVLGLLLAGDAQATERSCNATQVITAPCRCCKMDCWYTIARSATHELGHIPGQEGENEAMATLKLIRACMIAECSGLCGPARTPFRPAARFRPVLVEE